MASRTANGKTHGGSYRPWLETWIRPHSQRTTSRFFHRPDKRLRRAYEPGGSVRWAVTWTKANDGRWRSLSGVPPDLAPFRNLPQGENVTDDLPIWVRLKSKQDGRFGL
jgi:hypothetical protein